MSSAGSGARAAEASPWFSPEDAEYYRWLTLQIRPYARLTPHDEAGLGWRIAQGDRAARDRRLEDNERLVINVATKYVGRGLPFSDLVGEGNLGLIRAVSKFDHARGSRFYNYAVWWIFQSITRALAEQSLLIRMPVHLTEVVNKAQTSRETLLQEYGREPTEEELASATEIPIERIPEYLQLGQEASSRQDTSPNDDRLLRDIVAGRTRVTAEDDVFDWDCGAQLERLLQTLPVRDQRIIILREGLQGEDVHTLEEVGTMFQVTRERIRQIDAKAKRKLKEMIAKENGMSEEDMHNDGSIIRHRTSSNRRRSSPQS
jgi:RNA polymerase primary sigma factor